MQILSGLLRGMSDDQNVGASPPSFAAKGAPDAHLDFHFPKHPALDHHFIFAGERAYVRPMARHDSATIHTSWQAYVAFFSGAATSQQLFIDGDWSFRHRSLGALDMRDVAPGLLGLDTLLPVAAELPAGFRDELEDVARRLGTVDVVDRLPCGAMDRFREHYADTGRPVVISDSLAHWPTFDWTFKSLTNIFESKYMLSDAQPPTLIPIKDYLERVSRNDPVPFKLGLPLTRDLRALYRYPEGYTPDQFFQKSQGLICAFGDTNLARGGYRNATAWHRDLADNFLVELIGSKRVTLASPSDSCYFYLRKVPPTHANVEFDFSAVDPRVPDPQQYPLFFRASLASCILEPGDTLYIPCGWLHNVENLSPTCAINAWVLRPRAAALHTTEFHESQLPPWLHSARPASVGK